MNVTRLRSVLAGWDSEADAHRVASRLQEDHPTRCHALSLPHGRCSEHRAARDVLRLHWQAPERRLPMPADH